MQQLLVYKRKHEILLSISFYVFFANFDHICQIVNQQADQYISSRLYDDTAMFVKVLYEFLWKADEVNNTGEEGGRLEKKKTQLWHK